MSIEQSLGRVANQAADAMRSVSLPANRSVRWTEDGRLTQAWVDDVVLQAHLADPVWSDYVIVSERPSIWELGAALSFFVEQGTGLLVADDCLAVSEGCEVKLLAAISAVPCDGEVRFQLSLRCLVLDDSALMLCWAFREIAERFGVLAYSDSRLIDRLGVRADGNGVEAYISNTERARPVLIFPRSANLPAKARNWAKAAQKVLSGVAVVVTDDQLFADYSPTPLSKKFTFLGIGTNGNVRVATREDGSEIRSLFLLLEECPLPSDLAEGEIEIGLGASARKLWKPWKIGCPSLRNIREAGVVYEANWNSLIEAEAEPAIEVADPVLDEEVSPPKPIRQIPLDAEGFPTHCEDIVDWAEKRFGQRLAILPRAKRALAKSGHPDPGRIARAIDLLVTLKRATYLGDRQAIDGFEQRLLELRLRDGFSNAERLKGQTGSAYVVDYQGQKRLLDKHLCSVSSGFNDPKMIRIYYTYDRADAKVVLGWLPTHLPTSQS